MAVTLQDPAPGLVSVADGFHRLEFMAMGTVCKIDFAHASRARAEEFKTHVLAWLADFEDRFSRFRPDSLISRINRAA